MARAADVAVVFAGLPTVYESEGFDRADLGLPPQHDRLIDAVCAQNPFMDGAEVAQIYVHPVNPTVHRPTQELRAFRKVALKAGESRRVTIPLDRAFYAIEAGNWAIESGEYEIRIGASSLDIRLRHTVLLDGGTDVIDEALRRPTFTQGRLTVDDDTFTAMLGKPIPPADPIRPFHLNSTLAEISTTWLGASPSGDANRGGPHAVRCCAFSHRRQKCNPSVNIRRPQEI